MIMTGRGNLKALRAPVDIGHVTSAEEDVAAKAL